MRLPFSAPQLKYVYSKLASEETRVVLRLVHDPIVKKVVLDVLKPHQPQIPELASKLVACHGVEHVGISLAEIAQNTESIKVQVEGSDIRIDTLKKCIEDMGATIHSIDEVEVVRRTQHK